MSDQKEKMEPENHLTVKEFESAQMTHELIKSAEEEVSEIQKAIKEENDLDSKEFEVTPITQVFIKNENGQLIDTNATDTVWDRFYNGCDTVVNVDSTAMRFEGTGEGVLKMQDEKIELQKHEHNKYKVAESCDPLIIKNENDAYKFTDADTANMSTRTGHEHDFTNQWTKCEAVEELKFENDMDADITGITEITEEYIIKNENDHILNHPTVQGSHELHCNATFRMKRGLDEHISDKHSKILLCAHCTYQTTTKKYLANHMLKHPDFTRVSSKIYECAHCTYKSTFKARLARHMLKHFAGKGSHKPDVCIHCNKTFLYKRSLNDHIIKKHPEHITSVPGKIHECTDCTYKTTFKNRLAIHMLKHPDAKSSYKLQKCIHCDTKFSTKIFLGNHIINKHPDFIGSVSSKIHECKHCTYKTTVKGKLAKHMLKHPDAKSSYKLNECIHCNRTFINKQNLNIHIIKKHPEHAASVTSKIHECKYCVFKTTSKSDLHRHVRKHPGAYEPKECVHCDAVFKDKKSSDNHIINKHPEYIASVTSKIYECKYCVFKTTSKSDLHRHMRKHPGAYEPKECVHCDAVFKDTKSSDNHIINKHPEYIASVTSKIHECKYCIFKTTFRDRLARHIKQHPGAEGGSQLESCIHCNRTYRNKINLHDHIVRDHPGYITTVSSKVHECIYCAYKTTTANKFTRHMLKHPDFSTEVSSKIHQCAHCTYKTTFKSSLARHMLRHPGAKSTHKLSVCIHCNKTFINKQNLNDHIIKKHPEHIASVSSKIYECKYCAFKTMTKGYLTRHMGKHPGAEGYALKTCLHCNAAFKSRKTLDNHTVKKHPKHIESVSGTIYKCTHCTYKNTIKMYLNNHIIKTHPEYIASVSGKIHECIHCSYKTTFKRELDNHIIKTHPEHIATVSSKIHKCPQCTYKTAVKRDLNSHVCERYMEKHRGR
ncbi:unnamed protein product [Acanthoscelides obtectus]|uniref:C2H2-type domain-containing protein n=1 Tax=Acanthoscelides obtectus TaxID=200917 RepID=A0A9P0PCY8_ACAOB|nr:unnamed protein product [Acanthoscelides obtectus]CAK1664831.1 Zinc finger X-chromosomal protein [Acanthoscelides obtectus]